MSLRALRVQLRFLAMVTVLPLTIDHGQRTMAAFSLPKGSIRLASGLKGRLHPVVSHYPLSSLLKNQRAPR